jgi:hypothetical protein
MLLGRPPLPGDVATWNHISLEVTAVSGRGVAEAMVSRLPTRDVNAGAPGPG